MESHDIKYYLKVLINDGHKWQYTNINDVADKPFFYFSLSQFVIIILSFIISIYVVKDGIDTDFLGFLIATLSIFVGLFLSLILTVFDKYERYNSISKNLSERLRQIKNQRRNFIKKFVALTSYSILISLGLIVLLSFNLIFDVLNTDISQINLILPLVKKSIPQLIKYGGVLLYRLTVFYFFFDFILLLIYSLTSIYTFMKLEMEIPPKDLDK